MYRVPSELRVLVVDDDREFQEIISRYITEDPGYSVVTADSGQEALDIVKNQPLSAIIADYQMPEMDGLDLLKIIRKEGNPIPFVIFTGQGCESVAIEALNEGADFYLVKGEDPGPQFLVLRKNLGEIIARHQADEALRISEAENRKMLSLLKATLEATEDGILVETTDGEIVGYNERLLQLLNIKKEQVDGQIRQDIFISLSDQLIPDLFLSDQRGSTEKEEPGEFQSLLSFKDGRVIETHVRPQICEGNLVGRVWSYHDQTDRILAEQALRESREKYRILFDNSPISHLALDTEGKILEVNQTWLAMLGYTRKEVIGRSFESICDPSIRTLFTSCLSEIKIGGGAVHSLELILVHKEGRQVIIIADGLVVNDKDGNILQIQCALRDITYQRRTEERLRWTESLLEEIVDLLPFGICVTDGPDQDIIFENSRFFEIWGMENLRISEKVVRLDDLLAVSSIISQSLNEDKSNLTCIRPEAACAEITLPDRRTLRSYRRPFSNKEDETRVLWAFEDITRFKKQEEEIRHYARNLEILGKIISLSSRVEQIGALCDLTIQSVVPLMNYDSGGVYLLSEDRMIARPVSFFGLTSGENDNLTVIDPALHPDIFVEKNPLFSGSITSCPPDLIHDPSISSLAIIPLLGRGIILGTIHLFSRRRSEITPEEQNILLGIGKEIGGALIRLLDQEALRKARRNLDNLVNSINDMVFVIDAESGYILEVNEEVLRRLGYCREDLIGRSVRTPDVMATSIFPPDLNALYPVVFNHTMQTADGRVIQVETSATSGSWNVRKALFYVSRDITDSMEVQERVRSSEERLRAIFESSPIGIALFDAEGILTNLNKAALDIFGVSDQSMLMGFSLFPDIGITDQMREELTRGKTINFERMMDNFSGFNSISAASSHTDPMEIRVIVTPLRIGGTDENSGYLALIEDITSERQTIRLLREREAFNRGLVASLPDYVMIYNYEGEILYVNPSGIAGMRAEEHDLVGDSFFSYIVPEQRRIVAEKVRRRVEGEEIAPYEIRIIRFDGTPLEVIVQATMIPYNGSDAVLVVLTDITSRKEGEEALEKYTQTLQMTVDALASANKKLNLLSDVTRHDILNQVHIILSYLDLAETEEDFETQTRFLKGIEEAIGVIHRQIQFTRSYQDLGVNKPEWQDLSHIIDTLSRPGVKIANNTRGFVVLADPLLPKVFENLLDNSVRHGGEMNHVQVSADLNENGDVIIRWCDNGKGIALVDKEKIFEKGYGKNTGFGLFLIREILALTGIRIREEGVEGTGACFVMSVPKGSIRITS